MDAVTEPEHLISALAVLVNKSVEEELLPYQASFIPKLKIQVGEKVLEQRAMQIRHHAKESNKRDEHNAVHGRCLRCNSKTTRRREPVHTVC